MHMLVPSFLHVHREVFAWPARNSELAMFYVSFDLRTSDGGYLTAVVSASR